MIPSSLPQKNDNLVNSLRPYFWTRFPEIGQSGCVNITTLARISEGSAGAATFTATLQKAVDMGLSIIIPSGDWYINANISVTADDVKVIGSGMNNTTITLADGTNADMVTISADKFHLSNLTVNGNKANQSSGSGIVFTSASEDCFASLVTVTSCEENGFEVDGEDHDFLTCYANSCGESGWFVNGASMEFQSCSGSLNDQSGMELNSATGFIISGGSMFNNSQSPTGTASGIDLTGTSQDFRIRDMYIYDDQGGPTQKHCVFVGASVSDGHIDILCGPTQSGTDIDNNGTDVQVLPVATGTFVLVAGDTMTGTLSIEVPTAGAGALILKTTDNDPTNNLLEFQNSSSSVMTQITGTGLVQQPSQIQIAAGSGVSGNQFQVRFTGSSGGERFGNKYIVRAGGSGTSIGSDLVISSQGDASADIIGARFDAQFSGATAGTDSVGGEFRSGTANTATANDLYSGRFVGFLNGGNATTRYGAYISALTRSASQTLTNEYGLYVEDLTLASNRWAIFTNSGLVEFNDALTVDGSQDIIQTTIKGHSTQTNNLVEFQDSSSTVLAGVDSRGAIFSHAGTGSNNFIAGSAAGSSITTGSFNVLIGEEAGKLFTTGSNNFMIGFRAGSNSATSSGNNVFLGTNAGQLQTSGQENVAVGTNAIQNNQTGTQNTFIGNNAAIGVASNSHSKNVGIGYEVALAITTGSNNVLLGYQAGTALTTGTGNVHIGYLAGSQETTGSNKLFIDNTNTTTPLIYGEFDNDLVAINGELRINADSKSLSFGAGQDATIQYDGTDLIIDSQAVGSGHIVLVSPKTTTGDPTGVEGKIYWNTVDNVIKMYADGAWRTIASW